MTHTRRTNLLFFDSQYISLTLQDNEYLSHMFIVVQQQLRDYIVALQDVLPYVTATLTSVNYVDPKPEASKKNNFRHMYKEIIHFV